MAIILKARETKQNIGPYKDQYRYQISADNYNRLTENFVAEETALRSGIQRATVQAVLESLQETMCAWLCNGHVISTPFGTLKFAVTSGSVATAEEVKADLIKNRKVQFVPSVELKKALDETSVSVSIYDRNGVLVSKVTDDSTVEEDNSTTDTGSTDDGTTESGGGDENNPL